MSTKDVRQATIEDFGKQWHLHGAVDDDYWSSTEMFRDHFGDLFAPEEIAGKTVAEVGSGSGRIVNMICSFAPKKFYAVEPSSGIDVLIENTEQYSHMIEYLNVSGESFDLHDLDIVFSLGVIHHVKDPIDVVRNIHESLKPGGKFIVWVYGAEGNRLYLFLYRFLSLFTKPMPDSLLDRLSGALNYLIQPYVVLSRYLPLPLSGYLTNIFGKCGWEKRKYIIFDQLNPAYAKYYRRRELHDLLSMAGFSHIRFYHRHGYSWTALARKGTNT